MESLKREREKLTTGGVAAAKLLTDAKQSRKVHWKAVTGMPGRGEDSESWGLDPVVSWLKLESVG